MGPNGPEAVNLSNKLAGRKVVIFGLPAAFSTTCDQTHLPSFMRTSAQFAEKGVDEIICVSVNDPFVIGAWDDASGASKSGVTLLGDPDCSLTKSIGMDFSAPVVGLIDRSQRYAMLVEDGTVKIMQTEEQDRACDLSTGERFLERM